MLAVLLESRATQQRRVGGTVLSMLLHGAIVASVVALTLANGSSARPGPDITVDTIRFIQPVAPSPQLSRSPAHTAAPGEHAIPRPVLPTIDIPTITPTTLPPIDVTARAATSDEIIIGRRSASVDAGTGEPGTPLSGVSGVSDASAVDRAPRVLGRAPEPRYPAALRAAGISGQVIAEFVVDTLGRAELNSLRFPELANPLFADAVREALARYRFAPGEVAGRKVRTRVAVLFEFRLER